MVSSIASELPIHSYANEFRERISGPRETALLLRILSDIQHRAAETRARP
jgi:hypothetical protein